jgi:hypothetical protein
MKIWSKALPLGAWAVTAAANRAREASFLNSIMVNLFLWVSLG